MQPAQSVIAVVVTFRRPRLASETVRQLVEREGLDPRNVVVVVNGDGGLADDALARKVDVLRLPDNLGPAGGFRHGLQHAAARGADWMYLCEDDVGLFDLAAPRLPRLIDAAVKASSSGAPVGAIVAYGRDLNRRTGLTSPHQLRSQDGFEDVDVAAWGASLVSRRVVDANVLPDDRLFFGYEDFDFWLRVRSAGFRLLLDVIAQRTSGNRVSGAERDELFEGARPNDRAEPWRAYYVARNFLELSRRHGHLGWSAVHMAKSLRRVQLAGSAAERRATFRGLVDGVGRRLGRNERFTRSIGET